MSYAVLVVLALLIAVVDWFAVARKHTQLELFTKPAVMLVLLVWLALNGGLRLPLLWFWLGLAFSLAGDILLLPRLDRFVPALLAFILAHLCYIAGYNQAPPPLNLPALVIALLVLLASAQVYRRTAAGLRANGNTALQPLILAYTAIISLMLFSALATLLRPEWRLIAAALAAAGAFLFYISDAILAWNRFIFPLRYGRIANRITYQLGQLLIALAAVLHYS